MAAVIVLRATTDRGREILDELEQRTGEKSERLDDDRRRYYLNAEDVGVDGFDPMLDQIDTAWRDHITNEAQQDT